MKELIFLGCCVLLLGCNQKPIPGTQRQLLAGELPDPSIIEVDGTYYVTGSSNDWGPFFPIYKSEDLKTWTFVNYTLMERPSWTMSSYWAPELFYHEGTFYNYYTARSKSGVSSIGVAVSADPNKGFIDKGLLLEWGDEAIDAFVHEEDGQLYLTWKAYGLTRDKPIQILGARLSADGLKVEGEAFEVVTAEADSWERGGIEGQCIVERNGFLYLIYSGNACCGKNCDYQVGVARSKSIKGPWEKFEDNPILDSNANWKCPGHGTAVKSDNKWYYVYHGYSTKGFPYMGRSSLISELKWNDDTAWPFFDIDQGAVGEALKYDIHDQFDSNMLGRWWLYNVPNNSSHHAKTTDGKLLLTDVPEDGGNQIELMIGIAPDYADFTVTTLLNSENDAFKGLLFYVTGDNSLGLGLKGNELILWRIDDGVYTELNRLRLENPGTLKLKADVEEGHLIAFQYSQDAGKSWSKITNKHDSSELVEGDNLAWWSWGQRVGLFVNADSVSGDNTALFEDFHLEYR